jgi:hypothetical protein
LHASADQPAPIVCDPDVLARPVGETTVLVHLKTNRIYELNRTGGRLWALLQEEVPRSELESALAREFDVDREEVRREISELLDELLAERLVVET